MTPRLRVIAIASVLGLLFALGIGWLVLQATARPGANRPASAGVPTQTATAGVTSTGTTRSADIVGPPKPRRSVLVNGIRLDGRQASDTCGLVLLPDSVRIKVLVVRIRTSVEPTSGRVALDQRQCVDQAQPACTGIQLRPGGVTSCVFGVSLTGEPGEYDIHTKFELRATCTSYSPPPCDQVRGAPPTTGDPVDVVWFFDAPELVTSIEEPVESPPATTPPGNEGAKTAPATEATDHTSPT